jgi:acyl-CoA synthetase (NDP forming)
VNPKASVVGSMHAYPSVRDLPEAIDLAVIAVPRDAVLGVSDACAECGVKALVVITAGFAEVGPEGGALQQALADKVRGYGMRLVGPNCLGLLNTDPQVQLNASFSPIFPPPGRVALSSQSGALGLAVAHQLITAHGGRIDIASRVNQGATVTLTLPPAEGAQDGRALARPHHR